MVCAVCCSLGFTESAHVRARRSFDDGHNHRLFNIVPICPTCHYYFDEQKAFTLHHSWRCWVFSDIVSYQDSSGDRFPNPFVSFKYAYPPKLYTRLISNLDENVILQNQHNEFRTLRHSSPHRFFRSLELRLKHRRAWDQERDRPRFQRLENRLILTQELFGYD